MKWRICRRISKDLLDWLMNPNGFVQEWKSLDEDVDRIIDRVDCVFDWHEKQKFLSPNIDERDRLDRLIHIVQDNDCKHSLDYHRSFSSIYSNIIDRIHWYEIVTFDE